MAVAPLRRDPNPAMTTAGAGMKTSQVSTAALARLSRVWAHPETTFGGRCRLRARVGRARRPPPEPPLPDAPSLPGPTQRSTRDFREGQRSPILRAPRLPAMSEPAPARARPRDNEPCQQHTTSCELRGSAPRGRGWNS